MACSQEEQAEATRPRPFGSAPALSSAATVSVWQFSAAQLRGVLKIDKHVAEADKAGHGDAQNGAN